MLSEKYKNLLIDNRDKIVSNLIVTTEGFWAGLVAKRVLTDEDRENIQVGASILKLGDIFSKKNCYPHFNMHTACCHLPMYNAEFNGDLGIKMYINWQE